MLVRVVVAGVLGGLLMFVAGATEHMGLQWVDRTFKKLENDQAAQDLVTAQKLSPGMYPFPDFPKDPATMSEEESKKAQEEFASRYKAGPNGWIIVGPNGQEPMDWRTLLHEFGFNVGACFCAAVLLAVLGPPTGFGRRWLALVILAPLGWMANVVSHSIWYRFPWDFATDELMCSFVDWFVAGFVIALIVQPVATGGKRKTVE
jgi:hypothetical protein